MAAASPIFTTLPSILVVSTVVSVVPLMVTSPFVLVTEPLVTVVCSPVIPTAEPSILTPVKAAVPLAAERVTSCPAVMEPPCTFRAGTLLSSAPVAVMVTLSFWDLTIVSPEILTFLPFTSRVVWACSEEVFASASDIDPMLVLVESLPM